MLKDKVKEQITDLPARSLTGNITQCQSKAEIDTRGTLPGSTTSVKLECMLCNRNYSVTVVGDRNHESRTLAIDQTRSAVRLFCPYWPKFTKLKKDSNGEQIEVNLPGSIARVLSQKPDFFPEDLRQKQSSEPDACNKDKGNT